MSPGRMVAALAAALVVGAIVAALAAEASGGFVAFAAAVAFVCALAIAALLVLPVLAVQRRTRPSRRLLAAALVAGGLVVFPVDADFYTDADSAAQGGGVGRCDGVLPLAQSVRNSVADDPHAAVYYLAKCQD